MSKKETFDAYDFSKKIINGVPVFYKNLPWSPCIHVNVVFNNGGFDDPKGKEGLSHFLEHMIFNGSPLFKNKKIIKEWSKTNSLNSWNAWTSFHQTNYHLRCLPEKYDEVLKGMKDMIFKPNLKSSDVEHERKVITQEAWNVFQNSKLLAYLKDVVKNLYHGHRHENIFSPLGWPESVAKIKRDDLVSWHRQKYVVGNFFIVVVGKIDSVNISKLDKWTKDLPKGETSKIGSYKVLPPKENRWVKRADDIGEIKEQVEISIIRCLDFIPKELQWINSALKRVLHDILIEKLRIEKSLCYGVQVITYLTSDYTEVIINLRTDEANVEVVEKEFWKVIKDIKKGKYKDRFKGIKALGVDQIRSEEITSDAVENMAVHSIPKYGDKIQTRQEIVEAMKKVSYADIADYLEKVFDPKSIFTEIILPSKK